MCSASTTPTEVSKVLAERHKALRKQLNLSQSEMAKRSEDH